MRGPAPQGSSPVPPAGGLAPLKRGGAVRWGLTCWHCFDLKSEIEADFLRQSPAFASLRHPLCQRGQAASPLVGPASQGLSLVPPAGGLAPLKRGSAKRWGLTCWHCFYIKSSNRSRFPKTIPRPRFAQAPPFKRGQVAAPLVGPCCAGSIPRPARRRPGPFEKGLREAVGIDLLAPFLSKSSN